jgi:transposase-like protein
MNKGCPNKECKLYLKNISQKKDGKYYRRDDRHLVQRYKCKNCAKKYSYSTHTLEYKHKKRTINRIIRGNLASGMSMRRCAYNLKVHRTTISRKLLYLAEKARLNQKEFLASIQEGAIKNIQLDDLITSVHTKLKPLAISVVIDSETRLILGAKVSEIPAFGLIAKISRKKYGRRKNLHPKNLNHLLENIQPLIHPNVLIKTDEHKHYPEIIQRNFPHSIHRQFKSERASVAGLGELKNKKYDPLFMINHTLAMLRANINRLYRKTWCTSKDEFRLQDHVDLFIDYFNQMILEKMEIKLKKI